MDARTKLAQREGEIVMAELPQSVAYSAWYQILIKAGFILISRGKVGEMYAVPGHPEWILILRTDRLSIFDFVLNTLVALKGEVLTALTHYWLSTVLRDLPNHMVWSTQNENWNAAVDLKKVYPFLPVERCLVIKRCSILPFEMIYRLLLGGSVWKSYLKDGIVAGQRMPENMQKWGRLPAPILTPSTKADTGHDINISVQEFYEKAGTIGHPADDLLREAYIRCIAKAAKAGIIIADTKFEIGIDEKGNPMIADEVLTTDSSRFMEEENWREATDNGCDPAFYDKEVVREVGRSVEFRTASGEIIKGINNLEPDNPEHLALVHAWKVPEKVVSDTTERYLEIFERLIGMSLEEYQHKHMGVE